MSVINQIRAEYSGADDAKLDTLIADGDFTAAEKLLQARVGSSDNPITEPAAVRLEVLRRTRQDFALTTEQVLEEIRKSIPTYVAGEIREICNSA
jgi:hypothetical protein